MTTTLTCLAALAACAAFAAPANAETLRLAVGETRHLDAYRGKTCNSPAPSWESIRADLPKSKVVTYSDGGESTRNSKSCKKTVPTRAVNATGVRAGKETHQFSDRITIIVQ